MGGILMKKGIILLLMVLVSLNAIGDDSCRNVNLNFKNVNLSKNSKWKTAALKTMVSKGKWDHYIKQMPLYDQGQVGICYAYSAIQLLDHWRETKQHTFGKTFAGKKYSYKKMGVSSPVYAALLTRIVQEKGNPYQNKTNLDAGNINLALKMIKKMGMCREDVIQKAINQYAGKNSIDQGEFTELVHLLFLNFPTNPDQLRKMSDKQIKDKLFYGKFNYVGRKIGDDGNIAKIFRTIGANLRNGNLTNFMHYIFKDCLDEKNIYKLSKNIPDPKNIMIRKDNVESMKKHLRTLLNRKDAQPVGVGYCSEFLKNKRYVGTKPHGQPSYAGQMVTRDPKTCGGHASIIIGQKKIGGRCHYLIRNTWGKDCSKYDWKCETIGKGEGMGIWVEEGALFKNLMSMTYLYPGIEKPIQCTVEMKGMKKDTFRMEYPDMVSNKRQDIKVFQNRNDLIIKAENNQVKVSFGSFNKGFFGIDGGKVNLDKGSIEKMSIDFPPPRTRAGNIENFKLRCKKL